MAVLHLKHQLLLSSLIFTLFLFLQEICSLNSTSFTNFHAICLRSPKSSLAYWVVTTILIFVGVQRMHDICTKQRCESQHYFSLLSHFFRHHVCRVTAEESLLICSNPSWLHVPSTCVLFLSSVLLCMLFPKCLLCPHFALFCFPCNHSQNFHL